MVNGKTYLSIFFFAALMLVKVSTLHIYTHQDSDEDTIENCLLCDFALENQQTDFFFGSETVLVHTFVDIPDVVESDFINLFLDTSLSDYTLFSRPPPSI